MSNLFIHVQQPRYSEDEIVVKTSIRGTCYNSVLDYPNSTINVVKIAKSQNVVRLQKYLLKQLFSDEGFIETLIDTIEHLKSLQPEPRPLIDQLEKAVETYSSMPENN